MPSEITFPDPSGYTETPWTDPNGKQWVADSKGRWSAYKADTGGGSGAWDDITGKPAAVTALTGTNTGDETTSTIKAKLGVSTLSGVNTGDQDLSGLLSTSTASSTYQTQSGMSSYLTTATAASTYVSNTNAYMFGDALIEGGSLAVQGSVGAGSFIGVTGAMVENTPAGTITAETVQDAINELDSEKAPLSHVHSGADITSGNIATARIATALTTPGPIGGTTASTGAFTTVTASGAVTIGGGTAITTSGITGAQLVAAATPAAARTHIELEETYLPAASDAATRGNNTLADDPVLAGVALAANSRYHIRCLAIFTCPTTAGIACRLALSAAPSAESSQYYGYSTRAGTLDLCNIVQNTCLGGTVTRPPVTNSPLPFYFDICINTTAAITVALQYAQVTTDAGNPVTRKGGSWISVKKLNR